MAALIVLLVAIPFTLFTLFHASSARAEWFNSAWSYRKSIRFGNTGSAVTDQKVLIAFDTATPIAAGKMQSSCQDVRFTDAGGKLLQYYINVSGGAGVGCNDASSDFYVLMPSVVAGNNLIYIYYGQPSALAGTASANFGNTTFSPTSGPTLDAEEQSPGPVAVWKMDEGQGSTASDASGHGNTLALTSTAWATSSATLSNRSQYLQFNGATSVASRANDTEFDFGTGSFSISAWIRHSSNITGTDVLITKYNTQGWKVYMDSSGFICFGIDDDSSYGPDDSVCTTTSYADSTWHHIEVVKQGTTSITVYVDGTQKAQTTSLTATATLSTTATLYIGADSAGNTNWWDGWVDDVAIYPYARTASQVKLDILGSSEASRSATLIGASASDALTNGLVGYWKMDETSWATDCSTTSVLDASGNISNGAACPNASSPSPSTGKFGLGGVFDGSDDYVLVNDANNLDVTTTFTFSAWVNASTLASGDYYIFSKDGVGSDTTGAFGFFLQSGGRVCYETNNLGDGNICSDSDAVFSNGWYHVVATYDSAILSKPIFYVNGIQQGYFNTRTTVSPSALNTNLLIGRRGNNGSLFNGYIDELRIYNRTLSSSEVRQLYTWAPGPIGHWKMDENAGISSTYDSSGNGFTGTLQDFAASQRVWTSGKHGSALQFDGVDDYVDFYSSQMDSVFLGSQGTAEIWMKVRNAAVWSDNTARVLFKLGPDSSNSVQIQKDASNIVLFAYAAGGTSETSSQIITPTDWTHLVMTWDKQNEVVQYYVNGVLVETDTVLGSWAGSLHITRTSIGNNYNGSSAWDGALDDFRLYNYVRSPSQIVEDMNGGHPPAGSPVGSAIINLKFDEMQGTSVGNMGYGGLGYNGSISGATWYQGGKNSGAISTATSTNYVSMGDQTFVDNATGLTTGFWVKPITLATNKALVSKSNMSDQNSFAVVTDNSASDEIRVHIPTSTSDTGTYFLTSNLNLANDTWSYVSVIFNASESASTRVRVYKDGKAISGSVTGTLPDKLTTGTTSLLKVGASDSGSYTALNAVFDDMKIYPYPLTYDQMLIDYNGKAALQLGSLSTHSDGVTASNSASRELCVPGDTTSCTPPIGWWKMDEGTGQTIGDSSGNGNASTSWSGTTWARGKFGSGASFNGSDQVVRIAESTKTDLGATTDSYTISAWVKFNSCVVCGAVVKMSNSSAAYPFNLYIDSSNMPYFSVRDSSGNVSTAFLNSALTPNTWYHLSGVRDVSNDKVYLYVNGALTLSSQTATDISVASAANNDDLSIGNGGGSYTNNDFNGTIDEVRIYNYARTPAQIAWEYNRGAPIAHYKFDECQGTTAYNQAPNADGKAAGINGTITIGASGTYTSAGTCGSGTSTEAWNGGTTGKFGTALAFDGTNDNVSLGDNFDFVGGSFSVCAWIYPTGVTNNGYIIGKFDVTGSKGFWFRREYDTGFTSGTVSGGGIEALNSVSLNQWQHVCSVIVPTPGTSSIYKNGVLLSSLTTVAATEDNARAMVIGDRYDGLRPFSGMIDDVRIYNYPLTQQQVRVIMNENGAVRFGM